MAHIRAIDSPSTVFCFQAMLKTVGSPRPLPLPPSPSPSDLTLQETPIAMGDIAEQALTKPHESLGEPLFSHL